MDRQVKRRARQINGQTDMQGMDGQTKRRAGREVDGWMDE